MQSVLDNANKVTEDQIRTFLDICRVKYLKAKIEPGESSVIDFADNQVPLSVLSVLNLSVNPERK